LPDRFGELAAMSTCATFRATLFSEAFLVAL